jgi:hypothetical protein
MYKGITFGPGGTIESTILIYGIEVLLRWFMQDMSVNHTEKFLWIQKMAKVRRSLSMRRVSLVWYGKGFSIWASPRKSIKHRIISLGIFAIEW